MAAPNWSLTGGCYCGWGCTNPRPAPPLDSCRLLGRCECGWGCLRPRIEPLQITWTQAFQSRVQADRRISVASADRCLRLHDLAYFADQFDRVVLCFSTIEQIRNWFWWLADQERIANRKLALAVRFHSAVTSARVWG